MIYVIEVVGENITNIGNTTHAACVRNIIEYHFKADIDNFTKIQGYEAPNVIRAYWNKTKTLKVIIKKYRTNIVGHAGS